MSSAAAPGTRRTPPPQGERLPVSTVWWALAFTLATTVALAALDYAVLVVHGLVYGITEVMDRDHIPPPDLDRYWWALAVGVAVLLICTAGMLWLLARTAARHWPAWATSILATAVAAVVGASGLLLVLGINPVDVLLP